MLYSLIEWKPRNILKAPQDPKPETAPEPDINSPAAERVVRKFLLPRLIRVLALYPEARAAVAALFVDIAREFGQIPSPTP